MGRTRQGASRCSSALRRIALQYKQSIIVRRRIVCGYEIDSINCIDVAIDAIYSVDSNSNRSSS